MFEAQNGYTIIEQVQNAYLIIEMLEAQNGITIIVLWFQPISLRLLVLPTSTYKNLSIKGFKLTIAIHPLDHS